MKTNCYILTLPKLVLILLIGIIAWACEFKQAPVEKIYKAKPTNAPVEKIQENILPKSPAPIDSIAPMDSTSIIIKDTTETLQQPEKKPETKTYKKLYLYNIHKKAFIS